MSNQIQEALVCALDALESCTKGGYEDIDGDWVTTYHYDTLKVDKAKDAVRVALEAEADPAPASGSHHVEGTFIGAWAIFETASYEHKCNVYGDHDFALRVAQMLTERTTNDYIKSLEAEITEAKADRALVVEEYNALQAKIDGGVRVKAWDFEGKVWANVNGHPLNATLIVDDGVVL